MQTSDVPFNVSIMKVDEEKVKFLRPVETADIFANVDGNLHDQGLFSIPIFGRIGDEIRDKQFSYIDIKIHIFHPIIYQRLIKLKGLYKSIIDGSSYAIWDDKINDFVSSNDLKGETGFSFFLRHWDQIQFERNNSVIRDDRINLIQKYKKQALTNKILIMPAGLRDIETEENGRILIGEINELYLKLINISKTLIYLKEDDYSSILDNSRRALQTTFNEIYSFVENMLTGKKGFIQDRWGSRRIFNGTRNVVTAMDTSVEKLGGLNSPKFTDTVVGLYQLSKALLPITLHHLKNSYLLPVFSAGPNKAYLVNKDTLKSEITSLNNFDYDKWTSEEGLEKIISSLEEQSLRAKPIIINDHYVALIYTGPDKTFKIFYDIDELPSHLNKENVRPINLIELIYLSGYKIWNKYHGFVTRYPITGVGSSVPCTIYVKTTVVGEMRNELDSDWNKQVSEEFIALEFPTYDTLAYVDSLIIHSSRLAGLAMDFDGDTSSLNIVYTDEANAEVKSQLSKVNTYLDPRGWFKASANVSTINLVLNAMTG